MNVLEQVNALENGKGIQYLLDSACKIFNNPIYMIDAFYNLIAASDGPKDIYTWSELTRTGTFSLQLKEKMAKDGIFDGSTNSEKPLYIAKRENWSGGLITGHIVNKNKNWVGQITMHEYYTPFTEDSLEAYKALADKISSEIHDYDYFIKLPVLFFEDTVNKLLDKSEKNTLVHHSQAQVVRYNLENYLYVAVVSVARNNILESVHRNRLAYFCSLLKTRCLSYRYAVYKDKIVILMSSKLKNYSEEPFLSEDDDLFEINDLYAGVSASFEDIYQFSVYYDQAVSALENGMKSSSTKRFFVYDNA